MLDTDPRIDPSTVRTVKFPGNSRRYDARAVDEYLRALSDRILATNALVDDLQRRVDEAERRAAAPVRRPDLSEMTEDELLVLVGEETAAVLTSARNAASEIRSKAEAAAGRVVRESTDEARRIRDDAEGEAAALREQASNAHATAFAAAEDAAGHITRDAEAEAARVLAQARNAAEAELAGVEGRRAEARAEAERLLAEARDEGRRMVGEARDVRARVLADLESRRATVTAEIDALGQGRDELLAAYATVQVSLDEVQRRLRSAGVSTSERTPTDPAVAVGSARSADLVDRADFDAGESDGVADDPFVVDDELLAAGADAAAGETDVRANGDTTVPDPAAPAPPTPPATDAVDAAATMDVDDGGAALEAGADASALPDGESERAPAYHPGEAPTAAEPEAELARAAGTDAASTTVEPEDDDTVPPARPAAVPADIAPMDEAPEATEPDADLGDGVDRSDVSLVATTTDAAPAVADDTEPPAASAERTTDLDDDGTGDVTFSGDALGVDDAGGDVESVASGADDQEAVPPSDEPETVTAAGERCDPSGEAEFDVAPALEDATPSDAPGRGGDVAADDVEVEAADAEVTEPVAPSPALASVVDLRAEEALDAAEEREPDGVDALFARLRADRDETRPAPASPARTAVLQVVDGPEAHVDDAHLAPEELLAARHEAMANVAQGLNRAIKRQLADEQNVALDAVRRGSSTSVVELFGELSDHLARYRSVVSAALGQVADVAATAAGGAATAEVQPLSEDLAAALVVGFRDRVADAIAHADGDEDTLTDRLRLLYREHKSHRVGPAVEDALLAAHAAGVLAGTDVGTPVRWAIDPEQGACPDAMDNALAGSQRVGTPFPTGDPCPQAHPGCRCMLVVD